MAYKLSSDISKDMHSKWLVFVCPPDIHSPLHNLRIFFREVGWEPVVVLGYLWKHSLSCPVSAASRKAGSWELLGQCRYSQSVSTTMSHSLSVKEMHCLPILLFPNSSQVPSNLFADSSGTATS